MGFTIYERLLVRRHHGTERGSLTRSGRGRPGAIEKDRPGLMFGRAAAHRAAVRMYGLALRG